MQITVFSENELSGAAEQLLAAFPSDRVFCFYGEMGVGKTTFIKRICSRLGAVDTTSSPTFAIVNEYLTNRNESIYHFDFYRIDNLRDAYEIGVEEYLDSGYYCFMEWTENVDALVRPEFVKVRISLGENNRRLIEISK